MSQLPIDAEARGTVRAFKHKLAAADRRFDAAFNSSELYRAAARYRHAGATGRARAYRRLVGALGLPYATYGPAAVWAHLRPREAVIRRPRDAGQTQPAVTVEYILAGDMDCLQAGLWTLEIPDHALHRAAQRCRGIDLRAAIMQAHASLLAADTALPDTDTDILVCAGPGAFVGQLIYGHDTDDSTKLLVYFRPRTWLHEDQLAPGQVPLAPGPRPLGSGPLLPMPLRRLSIDGANIVVERKVA